MPSSPFPFYEREPNPLPASRWGTRAQLGATIQELQDLAGNRDGLWANEQYAEGTRRAWFTTHAAVEAARQAALVGWRTQDEVEQLEGFLAACEAEWRCPITDFTLPWLVNGSLFAAQKAVLLTRLGRHPDSVKDTFVPWPIDDTRPSGQPVRVRVFLPTQAEERSTILWVPSLFEGSDVIGTLAQQWNTQGHPVVCIEDIWRAEEASAHGPEENVARVIATVQMVSRWIEEHTGRRTIWAGSSLGASLGVLGALRQERGSRIAPLRGERMPQAAILLSPQWGRRQHWRCAYGSERIGACWTRDTIPENHWETKVRLTQSMVLHNIRSDAEMQCAIEDQLCKTVDALVGSGASKFPIVFIQGIHDDDQNVDQTRSLASVLRAQLIELDTNCHHLVMYADAVRAAGSAVQTVASRTTQRVSRANLDQTLPFLALVKQFARKGEVLPREANDYFYLTVPGLFTERYPGYMRSKKAQLDQLGLANRLARVDTDASVETNAKVLRDETIELAQNGARLVLIGHSKGGNDIGAMLALYPETHAHVRAVLTIQAPWLGTPLADAVYLRPSIQPLLRWVIERGWGGELDALTGLGVAAREAFVAQYPWPTNTPTLCFASKIGGGPTALAVSDAILAPTAGPTDGFVPVQSARIPGADYVVLAGVDHGGPVLPAPFGSCEPMDAGMLIHCLLAFVLRFGRPIQAL